MTNLEQKISALKREINSIYETNVDRMKNDHRILAIYHSYKHSTVRQESSEGQLQKFRRIQIPSAPLMRAQRRITKVLTEEILFEDNIFGVAGKGYIEHAKQHADNKSILRVDIKQFFPNCTSIKAEYLPDEIRRTILRELAAGLFVPVAPGTNKCILTLPTGAPTSPLVSNFFLIQIDKQLSKIAEEEQLTYTRYLDDMIFSTNREMTDLDKEMIKQRVIDVLTAGQFSANKKKSVWLEPNQSRMIVTGVDIRKAPKVNTKYVKTQIRPKLNAIAKAVKDRSVETEKDLIALISSFDEKLAGKLNYVRQVSPDQMVKIHEYFVKRQLRFREIERLEELDDLPF